MSHARSRALRTLGSLALAAIGVAQGVGHFAGWPLLEQIGRLSAASPLPEVFGTVNGHEYWAAAYALDFVHAGARQRVEIGPGFFAGVAGPHRLHMFLTLPLLAVPISPSGTWKRVLEYDLCPGGPLARAAGLPRDLDALQLEIWMRDGRRWSVPVECAA